MRKLLSALILSCSIWSVFSCRQENNVTVKQYPMFWTWLDYRPGMNFDSVCQVMNDIGMDGIMLNAPTPDDYRIAIPIARKHGIEVYAWLWTMNLEHDRDKILERASQILRHMWIIINSSVPHCLRCANSSGRKLSRIAKSRD